MISLSLTVKEAATLTALLDQEADGLEEDECLNANLAKRRARYLRMLARKVECAAKARV